MKILMLADFYPPIIGGVERHVQSLATELCQRGHQVAVFTTGHPAPVKDEQGVKVYRQEGIFQKTPLASTGLKKKWLPPARDWLLTRKLARIIERESPDIIHAHGWLLYSALPLKKRNKIPIVTTLHGYGSICPRWTLFRKNSVCDQPSLKNCCQCMKEYSGIIKPPIAYYLIKANKKRLKSVDKFVAVSSFVREAHIKHLCLDAEDIITIPNFYRPDNPAKEADNLPDDFILFVGALALHKGVDTLIKAYSKVKTPTRLLLIGYRQPYYKCETAGNILVMEDAPRSTVMQAISKCRFAVFPSLWPDPAPTVTYEAMSQKRAVIASDIGGFKDIVANGKTGILVPPGDSDRLSQAISGLLQNPETALKMGGRGYERFIKNYTPDIVVPRLIELYRSLV
jgi:glycosyltransferase involved in cell wall biosynthesis